jgi:4-amino-4-deoxy-L-arabinose transferase-like glycosyltransferase
MALTARSSVSPLRLPAERPDGPALAALVLATLPLYLNLDHTFWGSETRWLFIARGMLESGNWLEPRMGGAFYGDKPLLSYWAVALASWPFGRIDEVVARIPSVAAGTLSVLLTGWLAARVFGRRCAIPAGAILATSYGFLFWSRTASADLLNLMFITGAVAVYTESVIAYRRWQAPAFFVLLAVGGHVKGLPAWIVPLGIVGVDALVARRRELLRHAPWMGSWALVGAGLYALPFVASYFERGDWGLARLMWRENVIRALDAFDHTAPVWYYAAILPVLFLPWSLWLVGALGWAGRRFREHRGFAFALVAFAVTFLAFTASESRRSYYILPAFPFAALLVAGFWVELVEASRRGRSLGTSWWLLGCLPLYALAACLAALALFLLAVGILPEGWAELVRALPGALPIGLAALAGALVVGACSVRGRLRAALAASLASAFGLSLYFATGVQEVRDRLRVERSLAAEIKARFPGPGERVAFYHGASGPLRYYVGGDDVVHRPKEIANLLPQSGHHMLVACGRGCRAGFPENRDVICLPLLEAPSPAIGSLIEARDQYFFFRCVRR